MRTLICLHLPIHHLINSSPETFTGSPQEVYNVCNIPYSILKSPCCRGKEDCLSNNTSHLRELDLECNPLCCARIVDTHFHSKCILVKKMWPPTVQDLSLSERLVADLIQLLLNKGYHLYADNWYTSLPLYKYLYRQGTLACGTIRCCKSLLLSIKTFGVNK